jgi:hypothetical protein
MFKTLKLFTIISILIFLSGCAGKNFVRPTQETFKLGKTTYSQVVQQLGKPEKEGTLRQNNKDLKSIMYIYAALIGEDALEEGVTPGRAMVYYFLDNILVGEQFVSSFKSDNSNFDDTKIAAIVKGKTTRSQVVQLLGRPSGSYIIPLVKTTTGEAFGYSYSTLKGGAFSGFKSFQKTLLISFNKHGRVSEIEFTSSSNK